MLPPYGSSALHALHLLSISPPPLLSSTLHALTVTPKACAISFLHCFLAFSSSHFQGLFPPLTIITPVVCPYPPYPSPPLSLLLMRREVRKWEEEEEGEGRIDRFEATSWIKHEGKEGRGGGAPACGCFQHAWREEKHLLWLLPRATTESPSCIRRPQVVFFVVDNEIKIYLRCAKVGTWQSHLG